MTPLKIIETRPGNYSLMLNAGTTAVDGLVAELGYEPGGYFWEGIAQLLVAAEAPELDGRVKYDPEADMFVAYGEDRPALERLGELMAAAAGSPERMRALLALAAEQGAELD